MSGIDLLVSSVLVLIMFGIGVSLTISDISFVFAKPKALVVSLFSQMVFLPLIAFAICFLFDMPIYVKIGLIILASSPGGSTAGIITYLFKGNIALSIILTTLNSLLTLISIPLIVNYSLRVFVGHELEFQLPLWETMKEIFVLTVIPASVGVLLKTWNKRLANVISKYTKPVLIVLLGFVFVLKFVGVKEQAGINLIEVLEIFPSAIFFNVACFAIAYLLAKWFKLGFQNLITISIESAIHNTTMAFLISGTLMHNEQYGKVSIVYAMFSFWTALLFCYLITLFNKRKQKQSV